MAGHPLDPFLDDWSRLNGRDGFDLRARVYRYFAAPTPWTRERLRAGLRALLAFTPDERRAFDECFDRHFDATTPWEPLLTVLAEWDRDRALGELRAAAGDVVLRPRPDGEAGEATPVTRPARLTADVSAPRDRPDDASPPPEVSPPPGTRPWGALLLLGAGLLFLVGLLTAKPPPAPPRPTRDAAALVVADAGPRDASAMVVSDRIDPPPQGTVLRLEAVVVHDAAQPWWRRAIRHAGFVLLGALAVWEVLLLFDLLARWRAARPARFEAVAPPAYDESGARARTLSLRSPWPLAEPFDARDLDALAWRVGFSDDLRRPVLDVAASVAATARNGGLLDVVCRAGRSPSTLGLSRPPRLDPVARHLFDAFARGMEARGLRVEDTAGGAPVDLTLVFVDASEFARDPAERARVEALARRPHVALVELRDPGLWDDHVRSLPHPPAPFDAAGLAAALDAARTERPLPSARALPDGGDRERLGRATRLAAACALCEPFDLALLDALRRRFTPTLGFLAMQRVLRLDGVPRFDGEPEGLTMTPSLRAWLLDPGRCDPAFEAEVLRWQRERLAQTPCAPGSRAEAKRAQEIAWLDLRVAEREGVTLSAEATAAFVAVMEAQAKHPTLGRLFDVRKGEVGEATAVALAVEGDDLPARTLRERLAKLGFGSGDPVTHAWPSRWPRLALESAVVVAALAGAVMAAATLEEPRAATWSGVRSREVGSGTGRAFTRVCVGSSTLAFGERGSVRCGAVSLTDGLPAMFALNGVAPGLSLRLGALRGRYLRDTRGEVASVRVTGVDEVSQAASVVRPLSDDEDFLLDCGPGREIGGSFGHVSADGRRVTGLGVFCRTVVEHGRAP